MTLHELLAEGTGRLEASGIPEAALDARRLLLEAFHTDTVHFLMNRTQPMLQNPDTEEAISDYRQMIEKRCRRIPIQYILGSQEFMGLTFLVNRHVLIPRQDTETLVELVLAEQPCREKNILDLCTGSGCIAVSLAVKGGYLDVTATDLSEEALCVAKENAERFLDGAFVSAGGQETKPQAAPRREKKHFALYQGDLFQALPMGKRYDILVSNPPYIPTEVIKGLQPEVRDCEPVMALDGAADGLVFYRRIAAGAKDWLNPGASVYLEIGYDQGAAVSRLLSEAGFQNIKVIKDLPGLDRVVRADYQ